jgi:hypothetical protein
MSWLARQEEFRSFCMIGETEKVHRKLEEVMGIYWKFKR